MKTAPGFVQSWVDMLPAPWCGNPQVALVLAPAEAQFAHRETPDGSTVFGCLEHNGNSYGLQILKPILHTYKEHRKIFNNHNADMVTPAYVGPVSEIPQKLLLSKDFIPLLFRTGEMSGEFLNMRAAGLGLTTRENN